MKIDFAKNGINIFPKNKKIYKITPAKLKNDESDELASLRNFTIYLLVHYSKWDLKYISDEFVNITIEDLEMIKNDELLHLRYKEQCKIFFDCYIEDYLLNIYQNIAFSETLILALERSDI